jgi:hypothetical protein
MYQNFITNTTKWKGMKKLICLWKPEKTPFKLGYFSKIEKNNDLLPLASLKVQTGLYMTPGSTVSDHKVKEIWKKYVTK